MSVAPLSTPAAASAPVAIAAAPDSSSTVVSVQGLDRTGKIVPLLVVVLGLILTLAAWYGGQQANKAYLDTLIQERGARNAETRTMVETLRIDFNNSEKANAEFRGRTDASLQSIKDALLTERADRRDDRSH